MIPPIIPLRDHLPTRTAPFVNYALIAANVVVFLLELSNLNAVPRSVPLDRAADAIVHQWGLVPLRAVQDPIGNVEAVFTSMFSHDPTNIMHIGGNMLFLWIFGDNVEDAMGHGRYALFYLAGGVCAAAAQVLMNPFSTVPMVGASGAISAVLAAYLFLYPRSPITILDPILPLWLFFGPFLHFPAWLVIGEFFLVNLWDAIHSTSGVGVAFMAHVGGFIGGAVLLALFMAGRERMDDYARWQRWGERRRRRDAW